MAARVAVIGAGGSGVAATKVLADAGFSDIVCFERRDGLGGLWHFSDKPTQWQDEARLYRSTVISTSKEFTAFSDYPMPDHYPNFCHNKIVEEYFLDYARHFGVEKFIRYNQEVLSVRKHVSFESTGCWEIKSLDHKTGQEVSEIFGFALIAIGHHGDPNIPSFPGLNSFKGKTIHSKEFTDVFDFAGKRVCVIGIGNSGGDIAAELSKYSQVFLSTRRGAWIRRRLASTGMPWDYTFHSRFRWWIHSLVPRQISNYILKRQLSHFIDHDLYGLKSLSEPDSTHPTANDELPGRIACGMVRVKPNIERFTDTGVVFQDGSFEDNIDLVVFATGYRVDYPFLDKSVLGDIRENRLELYKHMWIPALAHQTLAFVGTVQPHGSPFPVAEMQARLAARVFKGDVKLPSEARMRHDFARHDAVIRRRYVHTARHTFQVDWLPYLDELATLIGCKPNLGRILLTDPVLCWSLVFGPGTPYQYRLDGPNSWPGARHAQLTVLERIRKPFATRPLPQIDSPGLPSLQAIGALTLLVCGLCYSLHSAYSRSFNIWKFIAAGPSHSFPFTIEMVSSSDALSSLKVLNIPPPLKVRGRPKGLNLTVAGKRKRGNTQAGKSSPEAFLCMVADKELVSQTLMRKNTCVYERMCQTK
ncbi:hypothetical protein RRG08_020880 [Elysia crispata]|uniref:Flavin-containing monooxygenase n=1 Tax=Elysia crispata TaxID=231223 RepID=A0AAE1CMI5_9GAST|nr:hypothetical protein RRG08_020880 [Elysia crispata]